MNFTTKMNNKKNVIKLNKNDSVYFKGKDGKQRIKIVNDVTYGLAQVDEKDRVIKGYNNLYSFMSYLVLGEDINKDKLDNWTYNGYYSNIGINLNNVIFIFNKDRIESVTEDLKNDNIIFNVTINLGDKNYKDIETINFNLDDYDYLNLNDSLVFILKKNGIFKYKGINIIDREY